MVWHYLFQVLEHLQSHRWNEDVVNICLFCCLRCELAENVEDTLYLTLTSQPLLSGNLVQLGHGLLKTKK